MEPKVWMNDVRNVLLTQFNAIRIFYFILLYLLISYDAFSTNSTLSPSANGQTYAIPLANGGYELTLIFKKTSAIADGSISVTAEGQKIVNDLASHMSSDGKTSFSVVRTVVVKDGTLNIQYSSPVAKLAVLLKQTDASSTPTYNDPPVASLVQPSDATYLGGDDITLVAKVSDGDGKVTQASFWVDDKKINEQTVSTASGHVSFVWKSVPVGDYQVQVKVKDNDGATASSTKLTYKVKSEDDPSSNPEEPETPEEPEAPVAEGEPGLYYAYYVGEWDVLPDFSELQPESQGVVPNFTFAPAKNLYTMGFKYTGYILIKQSGSYTFHVNANDGSNLYIDGKEVVNNDGKKGEAEEKSGSITLSQGYHPIRLTFFEQWGPQVLEVRYEGPGVKLQLVPDDVLFLEAPEGESEPSNQPPTVYAGKDVEITLPQTEITLSANATDKDGKIVSYQWAKVSGPTAKFTAAKSAQTKVTNLVAGTYEFSVTVKDDQGAEATNKVKVVVNEAPVVDEGEPRLYYAYYQGDWSKLPDFEKLTAVKKGTLSNFNLNLRNRNEQFGFAFEGYIDIKTKGTYKFYTASDDGSALYINGQRIVNNDGLHGKKEQSGHITLTKGKHLIQVMYFEQSGDEILEVSYQGPGIAKTIIPEEILSLEGDPSSSPEEPEAPVAEGEPGLYYAYYVGEWDVLPDFSELQPESQGVVPNFTFAPAKNLYTMGFKYTGYILIKQSGSYTFHVNANDGSNLYIDGKEVVNNDGKKGEAEEKSGSITLSQGYHPIRLTFFEQWGPQVLEVRYEGPGVKLQSVPDKVLFLEAPKEAPASSNNELVYINVHEDDGHTASGWNNLQSAPVSGERWELQNTKGELTQITLQLETAWDGANAKGYTSGGNNGTYPDAVTQSYYWTKENEIVGLSGLSPDKLYSFTFYASSMYGGDRTTVYRIGDKEVSLNASYNEQKTVTIENIRPSITGELAIEVSRAAGSSYGFLGALVIESKPSLAPSVKQEVTQQEDVVLSTEYTLPVAETIEMSVYPNPTIGIVNIKASEDATYWVSNLQGTTLKSGTMTQDKTVTLDLSSYPKGIYLVKTQTASEWATHKVIIQ